MDEEEERMDSHQDTIEVSTQISERTVLHNIVSDWRAQIVGPEFFRKTNRFPVRKEEYVTRSLYKGGKLVLPTGISFRADQTEYGFTLEKAGVDIAVLGFTVNGSIADCLQVQGKRNKYRELQPIFWEKALLINAISVAQQGGLDAITVIPAHVLMEMDNAQSDHEYSTMVQRLQERYDLPARALGFTYSAALSRYVLDLKNQS